MDVKNMFYDKLAKIFWWKSSTLKKDGSFKYTAHINIPMKWLYSMDLSPDETYIDMKYDPETKSIIIKKAKKQKKIKTTKKTK